MDVRASPALTTLVYPLVHHLGDPLAQVLVMPGATVEAGQLLALAPNLYTLPIHAALPARMRTVALHPSPLGEGDVPSIILDVLRAPGPKLGSEPGSEPGSGPGSMRTLAAHDPLTLIRSAGVGGHGGAGFPLAQKLAIALAHTGARNLVLNAVECESPLTCDRYALEVEGERVVDGLRLVAQILGLRTATIAVSENTARAVDGALAMSESSGDVEDLRLMTALMGNDYTHGDERVVLQTLFGRSVACTLRPSAEGFVVLNVGTALAVHRAVRERRPVLDRYVTIAGIGRGQSRSTDTETLQCNVRVPIGALMSEVLSALGERPGPSLKVTVGGQWMGRSLPSVVTPVSIHSACIQVLGAGQRSSIEPTACIRCARCNDVCPYELLPMQMYAARNEVTAVKTGHVGLRARSHFARCTLCARCDAVCPSHIPLAQRFGLVKQVLASQARDARHAQWADARSQAHEARAARRKAGLVSAATPVAPTSDAPLPEDKVAAAVARVRARRAQRADCGTHVGDSKQARESLRGSVDEESPGC